MEELHEAYKQWLPLCREENNSKEVFFLQSPFKLLHNQKTFLQNVNSDIAQFCEEFLRKRMCSMETAAEEKWLDVKELNTATTGTKSIMANLPFIPISECLWYCV